MTSRVLTVALDPGDTMASRLHQAVLASLPARFRVASGAATDVTLVSGDQAGWLTLARSAVGAGARGIMLAGTQAVTAKDLRDLGRQAAAAGAVIAAGTAYARDPCWSEALPLLAADVADSAVLDSVITVRGSGQGAADAAALRAALTEQLAMLRPLLGNLGGLEAAHAPGRNYVLAGLAAGIAVTLSGVVSGTGRSGLDVDLVGTARHWRARFDGSALAAPARISVCDNDGEHALPLVYESPRRAAWAELHDALCGNAPLPYQADRLAADLALAEAALT